MVPMRGHWCARLGLFHVFPLRVFLVRSFDIAISEMFRTNVLLRESPFIANLLFFSFSPHFFSFPSPLLQDQGFSAPTGSPSLCCEVVSPSLDPTEREMDPSNVIVR